MTTSALPLPPQDQDYIYAAGDVYSQNIFVLPTGWTLLEVSDPALKSDGFYAEAMEDVAQCPLCDPVVQGLPRSAMAAGSAWHFSANLGKLASHAQLESGFTSVLGDPNLLGRMAVMVLNRLYESGIRFSLHECGSVNK